MTRNWADSFQDDILQEWALELPLQPHRPPDHVRHLPHRSDLAFDSHYCETHQRVMEDRHDFPRCAPTLCGAITNEFVPAGTYGPNHPQSLSDYLFRMSAKAERHGVSIALGLHLSDTQGPHGPSAWEILRDHLKTGTFVAIGNISLDFTDRCHTPIQQQKLFARNGIKMAMELGLPMVIQQRGAEDEMLELLALLGVDPSHKLHLHCFTGTWDQAQKWCTAYPNAKFDITCLVTYPQAIRVHKLARDLPLDRIMLGSNSPNTRPYGHHHGHTKPDDIQIIATRIAALRNIARWNVLYHTLGNTASLYGLDLWRHLEP